MTIEECYNELGGDYNKMLKTLRMPALIQKFALKFLNDPSFNELSDALFASDAEASFRAAHNLKGVCGNLAFTKLYKSACEITELLRDSNLDAARDYFPIVSQNYEATLNAIKKL